MRRMRIYYLSMAVLVIAFQGVFTSSFAADSRKTESGKTQVVAKINKREITISDLRGEMARAGIAPNSPDAERIALENIVSRVLLTDAARDANLHRRPEALRRMATAQEQALADLYLTTASAPPEPTRDEIEDYIVNNPALFGQRRVYDFSVMSLPTSDFDEQRLTPLFDESKDFTALSSALVKARVEAFVTPATQASSAFPKAIRQQLGVYDVRDNIVIKGEARTQIMKIMRVRSVPVSVAEAPAIARAAILNERAQRRADSLLASLKKKSTLSYYRKSAAPKPSLEKGR